MPNDGPPLLTFAATAHGGELPVDLPRLIESRLLIQANSGGGKSRAIRYLLEQTHGRVQHVVLDREGEFATLRSRFDYLLAGPGGEVAADVRTAPLLARRVLELGVSIIIDLSDLDVARQRAYVAAYVGAMNTLGRDWWKDCLVVVDEAHLFAPEAGKGQSAAREVLATAASTWRKRGWCLVLATQRIAKLDKDVAAECLNKLIGRTSDTDKRRAGEELDLDRAGVQSLRALEPGTFWAYGPAIAVDPVLVRTGDVHTAPPARGAQRAPAPPTPDAVRALAGELADLPAQAEEEAAAVETLRRELARLRAQRTPVVDRAELAAEYRRGYGEGEAAAVTRVRLAAGGQLAHVAALLDEAAPAVRELASMLDAPSSATVPAPAPEVQGASSARPERVSLMRHGVGDEPDEPRARPSAHEQRLLNALAELNAIGLAPAPRATVGAIAGLSHLSGPFRGAAKRLRERQLVTDEGPGALRLTREGTAHAVAEQPPRRLVDLQARWLARFPERHARILEVLIAARQRPLARETVGARVGMSHLSGPFRGAVKDLQTAGVVEYPAPNMLAASALLFPEGLS